MSWRLLAATVALIACGGESTPATSTPSRAGPPPITDANECRSDRDCVITNQATCCSPCPGDPQPMTRRRLAEINHNCAAESCPSIGDKECEKPKSLVGLVAVCRAGICDVKSTPAGSETK